MNIEKVLEDFLRNTQNHTMKVLKDYGIYRHLKFSEGNSLDYSFEIVTWGAYLCISGDMGCQVFKRKHIHDMFDFFRSDNKELKIKPDYWFSKSETIGDSKTFNEETYKNSINKFIKTLEEDNEFIEELENAKSAEDIFEAVEAIKKLSGIFPDIIYDIEYEDYTYWYIWRLYAIVWAIQKYDEFKNKTY